MACARDSGRPDVVEPSTGSSGLRERVIRCSSIQSASYDFVRCFDVLSGSTSSRRMDEWRKDVDENLHKPTVG